MLNRAQTLLNKRAMRSAYNVKYIIQQVTHTMYVVVIRKTNKHLHISINHSGRSLMCMNTIKISGKLAYCVTIVVQKVIDFIKNSNLINVDNIIFEYGKGRYIGYLKLCVDKIRNMYDDTINNDDTIKTNNKINHNE